MRPQRIVRQFVGGAASLPKHAASTRLSSFRGYRAPADRKRDGGTEDIVGVVKLLDPGKPFSIRTKASCCAVSVVWPKQIRIPARKRDRVKSVPRVANPLLMPALLGSVRPIGT